MVKRSGFGVVITIRQHAAAARAMQSVARPLLSGVRPLSQKAMNIPAIHRIEIVAASSVIWNLELRRLLDG
ncbi:MULTISPECIES: hypothetical protein [Methylobacterium]|uniref:hypothetical protein n=1 Tax=Methylobacterium TaxID=407 RepID=UPI0013EC54EE|nr:hypothetical protein [Methylobacterium sp. DB0501]NGM38493.1 hypothetical protein [Methylobacterium sp. DB0501]